MKKIVFFFILCCVSTLCFPQGSKKIKDLEKQRKVILREIENTNKLLGDTEKNSSNLEKRVRLISSQITSRQKVLKLLEDEINGINIEQSKIESEISVLEEELRGQQKNYAKAIEGMLHTRLIENKFLFVLSGKSLTESYKRLRYLRDYSEWRSKQAIEIKDKSEQLKKQEAALLLIKEEKLSLHAQRIKEQENLKKDEIALQQEIKTSKQKQGELAKVLTNKQKQAQKLDTQIAKLIAEEVARQEKEAKRKQLLAEKKAKEKALKEKEKQANKEKPSKKNNNKENNKNTEKPEPVKEVEKIIYEKEDIKLSSNFESNKGKLPSPITGNSKIISRFGKHQHEQWNVTTSSNGIDIQSQPGAEARSVFDGEISRIINFPGYNNCIIIRHGNYYTFYGNIQNVYVKLGDKVKTGQSLGKAYVESDTKRSEIHFQLWMGTRKMNPESWLRK